MIWPIILPCKITFWCLAALVAIATAAAPLLKWKRGKTFLATAIIACVAFIPSCVGIMAVVDTQRFGVFEYDAFGQVSDFRVERYLPPAARAITIDKRPQGYRARYRITGAELWAYLDDLWTRYGDRSVVKRGELSGNPSFNLESQKDRFGDLGWPPLADAIHDHSPIAENGAGFFVWYDAKAGIAYEYAG